LEPTVALLEGSGGAGEVTFVSHPFGVVVEDREGVEGLAGAGVAFLVSRTSLAAAVVGAVVAGGADEAFT
jgi:hypothetical protein